MTFNDDPHLWEPKVSPGCQTRMVFVNGNNFRYIYLVAQMQNLICTYERGHQICSRTLGVTQTSAGSTSLSSTSRVSSFFA